MQIANLQRLIVIHNKGFRNSRPFTIISIENIKHTKMQSPLTSKKIVKMFHFMLILFSSLCGLRVILNTLILWNFFLAIKTKLWTLTSDQFQTLWEYLTVNKFRRSESSPVPIRHSVAPRLPFQFTISRLWIRGTGD